VEKAMGCGNWESDTLTEDLDLSYRAQLKTGNSNILKMWLPAELPAIISATRSQQFRWNKGGAENFSKNRSRTQSKSIGLKTKAHGMFHLLNSTMFLAIFTMAVLSVPMLYIKMSLPYSKYLTC
jgi:cellulose synthase/poly-beta-1,6-N-acetylglucosamine synthase-like glycosyltransferase